MISKLLTTGGLAALASVAVLTAACSSGSNDETTSMACAELGATECGSQPDCAWNGTDSVCQPLDPDAGWVPCPTDCKSAECGMVILGDDQHDTCILKPDCTGLDETTCKATIGCGAVIGRRTPLTPDIHYEFVGCGDGTGGFPGALVTCTAPGPDGPCWYLGDTRLPSGWEGWNCVGAGSGMTVEECMQNAPF